MPVLRPEVSRLLEEANLKSKGKGSKDIKEILEESGLGLSDTLASMKQIRDYSESESTRVRINESILKMHGVMKEETASVPSITIQIIDPSAPSENPILLPRELHKMKESDTIQ